MNLDQAMKAIAVIAVVLAVVVRRPDLVVSPAMWLFILILAAGLYGISRLPFRVRLAIELAIAGLLLLLGAWIWRPAFYAAQAERTERLARLCSTLAERADDERSKGLFRREADEYGRRARALRMQAIWYGLIRSLTRESPVAMTEWELIEELGVLEALDQHEAIGERMGIPKPPRRP